MKRTLLSIFAGTLTFAAWQAIAVTQTAPPQLERNWGPPQLAFDIPKTALDILLKNAPPATDQQIRVVDMGKYNLGVGIIHRGPTKDKPGDPISGPYHEQTAEVYIMLSGSGVLTTGGRGERKHTTDFSIVNGPGGTAMDGPGSVSRRASTGDIIIIPPGVLHAWSQITDHVTYLSVRPDPDRTLPGGYVNPLLLKEQMPPVQTAAASGRGAGE